MRKGFKEIGFEHSRGRSEQPVRGIDDFHIGLVIDIPYLRHEWAVWLNDSADLLFKSSDDHGVRHDKGQRMMKLHLLLYGFEVLIFEVDSSSRVVALEAGHIKDVIFEDDECLARFMSVALDFIIVFECVVYLFSFGCHQLNYKTIQISSSNLLFLQNNGKTP